jgi:hypothetical protein
MVHDAYLFVLHFHRNSFETGWQGEMAWCREAQVRGPRYHIV